MGKRKILLLSDDLRMYSGVATVSKDIVTGTLHHYDWVQIGGAINHPDDGKVVDLSDSSKTELGIKDAYLKIYATNGYGSPDLLRQVINIEKPDAILHYTDPRFWLWFYQMEREIRVTTPILYYQIWDDLPDPMWNENFYRSCDLLMAISKQTYGINKRILSDYEDWQVKYIPHGVSSKRFFQVNSNNSNFQDFKKQYNLDKYDFKVLYLNRNIRRKMPGDVILGFKHFMDQLSEDDQKKCVLIFHTAPVDENGTDLREVCKSLIPDYSVIFTYDDGGAFDDKKMNYLYNAVDLYINIASNEGFGLGSLEALTVGTPIIVNVTGGLQDQCGFKKWIPNQTGDGQSLEYLTADDYIELGSNHQGKYKEHGEWVIPVWPKTISLQGSPPTPYIFDDRCDWKDAADAILKWFNMGHEERARRGEVGRQFVADNNIGMGSIEMSDRFIKSIDQCFKKWHPKDRFELIKTTEIEKKLPLKLIGDE